MAVTINADNGVSSGSAGLKQTADSTGVLALQTNGTTAVSISTGQVVTLTNALPVASGGTGATSASAARTSLGLVIGTDVLAPNGSGASLTSLNASNISSGTLASARLPTGTVLQVVNTMNGAVATGTTTIPQDNTIPQNTEGTEFMTLSITPTSTTSKLRIDVVVNGAGSSSNSWITALFQDSTANALASANYNMAANNVASYSGFTHYMTSGTTSLTTFKVRVGTVGAGTFTFNGQSGARLLGGVMASSITITEIAA